MIQVYIICVFVLINLPFIFYQVMGKVGKKYFWYWSKCVWIVVKCDGKAAC